MKTIIITIFLLMLACTTNADRLYLYGAGLPRSTPIYVVGLDGEWRYFNEILRVGIGVDLKFDSDKTFSVINYFVLDTVFTSNITDVSLFMGGDCIKLNYKFACFLPPNDITPYGYMMSTSPTHKFIVEIKFPLLGSN